MCLFSLWYIHFQVLFVQVRKGFALCDSCIRQTLDFVQVFRWELADAAWWVSMECRLKVGSLFGLATAFPVDLLTVKGTNWTKTYLCSWRWKFLKLSELPPQKGQPFWDMVYLYIYILYIIYISYIILYGISWLYCNSFIQQMNGFLLASQKVPGRRTLPSKPIHEANTSKHPGPGAGLDFLGETSESWEIP